MRYNDSMYVRQSPVAYSKRDQTYVKAEHRLMKAIWEMHQAEQEWTRVTGQVVRVDKLKVGETVRLKATQPMRDVLVDPGEGPADDARASTSCSG